MSDTPHSTAIIEQTVEAIRDGFDRVADAAVKATAEALDAIQPLDTSPSFWLTFGVQYQAGSGAWGDYTNAHPRHPDHVDGRGFVRIEAPSEEDARELAIAHFESAWSFTYDHEPEPRYAPLGELGVIHADGRLEWHSIEAAA